LKGKIYFESGHTADAKETKCGGRVLGNLSPLHRGYKENQIEGQCRSFNGHVFVLVL